MIRKLLLCATLTTMAYTFAHAGLVSGSADIVLGQASFSQTSAGSATMNQPRSVAIDEKNNRIFVADTFNNRVLWWNSIDGLASGKSPDGVIGQADFSTVSANRGGAASDVTLSSPYGVLVDGTGNLWVADYENNRVLRYSAPFSNGMAANLVLGQNTMNAVFKNQGSSTPTAYTLRLPISLNTDSAGNLWVADFENHRVLRYSAPFASGMAADTVLGQQHFNAGAANDVNGDNVSETVSASTFYYPEGVFVDNTGSVWVADHMNHRFLRFGSPVTSSMNASLVIGQVDFTHSSPNCSGVSINSINCPYSICMDQSGNVWAVDCTNNRILRYNAPFSNGMDASQVLGQESFTISRANRGVEAAANTLDHPCFVTCDSSGNLWTAEFGNHRIMKYKAMKINSLNVRVCPNTGTRNFVISGEGIAEGTTVSLIQAGQSDIQASQVTIVNENQLTCKFVMNGAPEGMWDMALTANNYRAVLRDALLVLATKVSAAQPSRAINWGAVDIVVSGKGFFSDTALKLTKQGYPDINPDQLIVDNTSQISCKFTITDVATGYWNISVGSGSEDAGLANGFDIHFPSTVARSILKAQNYRVGIELPKTIAVMEIPANALAEDSFLTMNEPQALALPDTLKYIPSDVAVDIKNDKGVKAQRDITISFYYNDAYLPGIDKARTSVYYFDLPLGKWVPIASRAMAEGNMVYGRTRNISSYRILQKIDGTGITDISDIVGPTETTDLNHAFAFPNPYKPNSGADFGNSGLGNGIVFNGLSLRAKVRIFDIAGEQIVELNETAGTGFLVWDTTNDKGDKVASGVYLYYITNPDNSQKVKGKLAIVR